MSTRPGPVLLWVQKWEEAERGWGTRPDGYTLHRRKEDIAAFLAAIRAREAEQGFGPNNVPEEYTRPCGNPYQTTVDDNALIERVKVSDHGIWGPNGNVYPVPFVPNADVTGWQSGSP